MVGFTLSGMPELKKRVTWLMITMKVWKIPKMNIFNLIPLSFITLFDSDKKFTSIKLLRHKMKQHYKNGIYAIDLEP